MLTMMLESWYVRSHGFMLVPYKDTINLWYLFKRICGVNFLTISTYFCLFLGELSYNLPKPC